MSELAAAGQARNPVWEDAHVAHHPAFSPSLWSAEDLAQSRDEFQNPFKIRVAHTARASSLVQRRYAWRGYSTSPLENHSDGRVTLAACVDDATVATITATLDGRDGLYVGRTYADEVNALRADGRKLCEFTKLAVDESVRSQAVLGAIFHVACIYVINLHQCTDVLVEVNPRHVRFYERMLGFQRAADERLDPEVNAPAVLLRLDLKHCAAEIARLGGRRRADGRERSFYPYFFSPEEAEEIVGRLGFH